MTEEELKALEAEKQKLNEENTDDKDKSKEVNPEDKSKEDKPKISDAEAKAIKELMKWKEKARAAEAEKAEIEGRFKDVDLEKAKAALAQLEEAENKELERKGEYERLLAKQKEAAEKAQNELAEKLKAYENQISDLTSNINNLTLGNSFATSKFIGEKLTLTPNKTMQLYGGHFELQDGKLVGYDKPKGSANRTAIVDASGDPVSFEAAIEAIINADPDKDHLIKSEQRPGAGSKPGFEKQNKETTYTDSHSKIAAGLAKLDKIK